MSETGDTGEKSTKIDKLLEPIITRKVREVIITDNAKPHLFTPRHLSFLQSYSQTLDVDEALKISGVRRSEIEKSSYLAAEVQLINECAMYKHRAASAMGRHERLMDKIEQNFDKTHDDKTRASFGSILAKMSETSLKAAGEFGEKRENNGLTGVQVIINLGDPLMGANVIDVQSEKEN